MNTKSASELEEMQKRFRNVLAHKSEEEEIDHDAKILMSQFLHEFQKYQEIKSIKRNRLAKLIKTSASYLTQIFRGNKPLNFETIAKIQKMLNIRFEIQAFPRQHIPHDEDLSFRLKNIESVRILDRYKHLVGSNSMDIKTSGVSVNKWTYKTSYVEKEF